MALTTGGIVKCVSGFYIMFGNMNMMLDSAGRTRTSKQPYEIFVEKIDLNILEVSCGKLFWRKWRFKSCWTSIWTNIVNSIRLQQEFISILYSPFSSYTITAVDVSVTLHKPSKPGFQPLASHTSMLSYDEDLLLNMSSRGCF